MKEKIQITIENLDDMPSVLKSIELLFQKLIDYYNRVDVKNLNILILSMSVWFGKILRIMGYDENDFKGENNENWNSGQ
jgi:hypothetical protein